MGKRKKKATRGKPDSYIPLVTALINLIVALILLWEKLNS